MLQRKESLTEQQAEELGSNFHDQPLGVPVDPIYELFAPRGINQQGRYRNYN